MRYIYNIVIVHIINLGCMYITFIIDRSPTTVVYLLIWLA